MADEPDAEFVRKYEKWERDGRRTTIHFYALLGPKGTVAFQYMDRPKGLPVTPDLEHLWPMASDLGYHSPVERFPGQYRTNNCPYLAPPLRRYPCFYDGSSLDAEFPMRVLLDHGEEPFWRLMREHYAQVFESDEYINGFGELLRLMLGAGGEPPA